MNTRSEGIVIVGGGAGGLELAIRLAKAGHKDVLLMDRDATHVWKPRLHELAAGFTRASVDELDYAGLAQQWGFRFEQGELADVDAGHKRFTLAPWKDDNGRVLVAERQLSYDALVLALGGVTPDMGVDGVLDNAFLLDSERDAERLYRHFSAGLLARRSQGCSDPYHVAIVGTGATGVELAGLLATEARASSMAPKEIQPEVKVTLLEATDTFMPGMDDEVRHVVQARLQEAGVDIHTAQQVNAVSAQRVTTEGGQSFPADMTIWAAGRVGPSLASRMKGLAVNDKRQWIVRPSLQAMDNDAVFALGDCSWIEESPAPPTAQAASEQAEHLARELPRYLAGDDPVPFRYEDKGTLLSLGEAGSVGTLRGVFADDITLRGRLARAAYQGLQRQHQFLLLGPWKGAAEAVSDAFGRSVGPRLKVH
ncbi:NAD(P)/FAD-dependent oxidoreductase [Halomonas cupida]|uniref:NAD(P)/FAD-dependent oxidoreductase n=1 Tax=Halomonas TaxID=2745 RepID=UPI001A8CDF20|nr:FAD-dependent oxidoreductase [Halomonas litopenaei]MBN8414386.1 FAD-dependent oxidoreductase [Halomonas litopenaei]